MDHDQQYIDGLVSKAQKGDKESFGLLYDEFLTPIYRYIFFRVSSEAVAEDLTSDIFFKALDNLSKYENQSKVPFSAWLFRIAKNTLIDYYRKDVPIEEVPDEQPDDSSIADARQETQENLDRKRLLSAINDLPDMQSQAIILRYFADRTNPEIAAILVKSETAIRILQSRGLKKLKSLLDQ